MPGQRLETIIAINAEVGNGFAKVGSTLSQLGSLVDGMSQKLIDFGTESVDVYRKYELSMADAQVALSTIYGKSTRELSGVMKELDVAATEWAATTIFHTDDVANAIAEAAHAGWDLDQIMAGIPASMELAQAGGLDLSEAVDYIVKTANAAGLEFEDLDSLIDHWAFTANSSATDIGELGDAMLRMGATMKFAGGTDELLTMLAVLADAGTVGSDAGTLLRNSMLRLVAPTKKASEMMATLGATSEELDEIAGDSALTEANKTLEQVGFSAYDSQGNLKDMLTIFQDLSGALDQIGSEDERNKVLSAIFPTRSITGAMALIEAATEDYNGLYEALKGGDAEGYGEYASETMMDTLNGSIETFQSKVENLKKEVGEELAPWLEDLAASFGGIVDSIAGMDDTSFSILVDALKGIAVLGPGLLAAAGGFRLVGSAIAVFSNPMGAAIAGGLALGTTIYIIRDAIEKLSEANFRDKFGDLELDMSEVQSYIGTLQDSFAAANADIDAFESQLNAAVEDYETASSELKSDLLIKSLTDAELTDTDIGKFTTLGGTISDAVIEGVESKKGELLAGITAAFGGAPGENGADIDNPIWGQIISVISQGMEADIATAQELSQRLREALTSAFEDGSLTGDEIANIQKILDEQNKLLAMQQDRENYLERQRILRKAQTLGYASIEEAVNATEEARAAELEDLLDRQEGERYDTAAMYDRAIEEGWQIQNTFANPDGSYGTHKANKFDRQRALDELDKQHAAEQAKWEQGFNDFILGLVKEGAQDNLENYDALQETATMLGESNGVFTPEILQKRAEALAGEAGKTFTEYINRFGDALLGAADSHSEEYDNLLQIADVVTAGSGEFSASAGYGAATLEDVQRVLEANGTPGDYTIQDLSNYIKNRTEAGMGLEWDQVLGNSLQPMLSLAAQSGLPQNYEGLTDLVVSVTPEIDQSALPALDPIQVPVEPQNPDQLVSELESKGMEEVSVDVNGDVQQLEAVIDGEEGQTIMQYVDGDATELHAVIMDEDGQVITTIVDGNTSRLQAAINAIGNQTVYVNIAARNMLPQLGGFAEGGRADIPSIFGEAGPEWAIPEEHTNRTAELLNEAREASGFTWPELISRFGGLNADPGHTPSTLIYSPTINAADVNGVERALMEDKARLEKWWADRQIREEMEVYA